MTAAHFRGEASPEVPQRIPITLLAEREMPMPVRRQDARTRAEATALATRRRIGGVSSSLGEGAVTLISKPVFEVGDNFLFRA
jgi:predicted O-linked N-acetylglucosamine transferase (SPINDLY family)